MGREGEERIGKEMVERREREAEKEVDGRREGGRDGGSGGKEKK